MRLIHCADIHLDSPMHTRLGLEKSFERKTELLRTFLKMIEYAIMHEIEGILISGDMFDSDSISTTARDVVYDAIVSHPSIRFFVINGNHDEELFFNAMDMPKNLYVFGKSMSTVKVGEHISISGVSGLIGEDSFYENLSLDEGDFNIVMLHGQDDSSVNSSRSGCIHLGRLRNRGIDYLALGHIHSYRKEPLDNRGILCYPGCLEGRGFDETGEHGFVVLDIDTEQKTFYTEFVPIAYRHVFELEADIAGCESTTEVISVIESTIDRRGVSNKDIVRVILTGEIEVDYEIDEEYIEHLFELEFYYFEIKNCTKIIVDEQNYMFDESLRGEFVRLVMESDEIDEVSKPLVVKLGLSAINKEAGAI